MDYNTNLDKQTLVGIMTEVYDDINNDTDDILGDIDDTMQDIESTRRVLLEINYN